MNAYVAQACFALAAAMLAGHTHAQYPTRPIRMIVPFAASGPTDTVGRHTATGLSKLLGQSIVIDNRPGADGAIAAKAVISAAADGHTLFFTSSSVLALPLVTKPAPFDTLTDMTPVIGVGRFTYAMYVNPGMPTQSMKDFIAHGRNNPGKVTYGSSNLAEFLAAVQVMKPTGVEMLRVPYKGQAQMMPDLVAGRVQVGFGPLGGGLPFAKDGRVRILAVSPQRSSLVPEVPTMAEVGIRDFYVASFQMILAPARTPPEIVNRLARDTAIALQEPELRSRLESMALVIDAAMPQALTASIRESDIIWSRFAQDYLLAPK